MPLMHLLHVLLNLNDVLFGELDGQEVGLSAPAVDRCVGAVPGVDLIIVHLPFVTSYIIIISIVVMVLSLIVENEVTAIIRVITAPSSRIRPCF